MRFLLALACAALTTLAACGGGSGATATGAVTTTNDTANGNTPTGSTGSSVKGVETPSAVSIITAK